MVADPPGGGSPAVLTGKKKCRSDLEGEKSREMLEYFVKILVVPVRVKPQGNILGYFLL